MTACAGHTGRAAGQEEDRMGSDGAHMHGHGGGGTGIGPAIVVLLLAIGVAEIAQPVINAAVDLIHAVLIIGGILLGTALAAGAALVAWRVRRSRAARTRVVPRLTPGPIRSVRATAGPQEARAALDRPAELHVHFHGMSAADVAEVIARQQHAPGHVTKED